MTRSHLWTWCPVLGKNQVLHERGTTKISITEALETAKKMGSQLLFGLQKQVLIQTGQIMKDPHKGTTPSNYWPITGHMEAPVRQCSNQVNIWAQLRKVLKITPEGQKDQLLVDRAVNQNFKSRDLNTTWYMDIRVFGTIQG